MAPDRAPAMSATLFDLIRQLQREAPSRFKRQRQTTSARNPPLDYHAARRRRGKKHHETYHGVPEHEVLIGINGGRDAALTDEVGNGEW